MVGHVVLGIGGNIAVCLHDLIELLHAVGGGVHRDLHNAVVNAVVNILLIKTGELDQFGNGRLLVGQHEHHGTQIGNLKADVGVTVRFHIALERGLAAADSIRRIFTDEERHFKALRPGVLAEAAVHEANVRLALEHSFNNRLEAVKLHKLHGRHINTGLRDLLHHDHMAGFRTDAGDGLAGKPGQIAVGVGRGIFRRHNALAALGDRAADDGEIGALRNEGAGGDHAERKDVETAAQNGGDAVVQIVDRLERDIKTFLGIVAHFVGKNDHGRLNAGAHLRNAQRIINIGIIRFRRRFHLSRSFRRNFGRRGFGGLRSLSAGSERQEQNGSEHQCNGFFHGFILR